MTVKRKPHHDLPGLKAQFTDPDDFNATQTAFRNAYALGFQRVDMVAVVQALQMRDFVKSETAHSPPNHRVWHDTYLTFYAGHTLYLKFAGETLIDVTLTSFKEASRRGNANPS